MTHMVTIALQLDLLNVMGDRMQLVKLLKTWFTPVLIRAALLPLRMNESAKPDSTELWLRARSSFGLSGSSPLLSSCTQNDANLNRLHENVRCEPC